jgi:hypothetical protein
MASAARDMLDSESEHDSLGSTQSAGTGTTAQKERIHHSFSCWTFQLVFSADVTALNGGRASSSVTLQEWQKILLEHIRSRVDDTITKFIDQNSTESDGIEPEYLGFLTRKKTSSDTYLPSWSSRDITEPGTSWRMMSS